MFLLKAAALLLVVNAVAGANSCGNHAPFTYPPPGKLYNFHGLYVQNKGGETGPFVATVFRSGKKVKVCHTTNYKFKTSKVQGKFDAGKYFDCGKKILGHYMEVKAVKGNTLYFCEVMVTASLDCGAKHLYFDFDKGKCACAFGEEGGSCRKTCPANSHIETGADRNGCECNKGFKNRGGKCIAIRKPKVVISWKGLSFGNFKGGNARQSSTAWAGEPWKAADGSTWGQYGYGKSCSHTDNEFTPWWYMDLGGQRTVASVTITNRHDCCQSWLNDFDISVVNRPPPNMHSRSELCYHQQPAFWGDLSIDCYKPLKGRYLAVRLKNQGKKRILGMCEVTYSSSSNGRPRVTQSSIEHGGVPEHAVDGVRNGMFNKARSCTHTHYEFTPWWTADFGSSKTIASVAITNRADCCGHHLTLFTVAVTTEARMHHANELCFTQNNKFNGRLMKNCVKTLHGRFLTVRFTNNGHKRLMMLCEVEYYSGRPYNPAVMAKQISEGWGGKAERAIDGDRTIYFAHQTCSHTGSSPEPWWYLNMGAKKTIHAVRITNRKSQAHDLTNYDIAVVNSPPPAKYSHTEICDFRQIAHYGELLVNCQKPVTGQYLVIKMRRQGGNRHLVLCEVEYFTRSMVPRTKQSTVLHGGVSEKAVDGNRNFMYDAYSCIHTAAEHAPWWYADMGKTLVIRAIAIQNRMDWGKENLNNFEVSVMKSPPPQTHTAHADVCLKRTEFVYGRLRADCDKPVSGRYLVVRLKNLGRKRYMIFCEVEWFVRSLGLHARQSSIYTGGHAEMAIDGIISTHFDDQGCSHTKTENKAWWSLDFGANRSIRAVRISNRYHHADRLHDFDILMSSVVTPIGGNQQICHSHTRYFKGIQTFACQRVVTGRYLIVRLQKRGILTLCEVQYW